MVTLIPWHMLCSCLDAQTYVRVFQAGTNLTVHVVEAQDESRLILRECVMHRQRSRLGQVKAALASAEDSACSTLGAIGHFGLLSEERQVAIVVDGSWRSRMAGFVLLLESIDWTGRVASAEFSAGSGTRRDRHRKVRTEPDRIVCSRGEATFTLPGAHAPWWGKNFLLVD